MNKRFTVALLLAAGTGAVLLLLFSPLFAFQEVTVTGNTFVSAEEIVAQAQAEGGNFFLFSPPQTRARIMENLYIGGVTFRRAFPNRLYITVNERFLSGYVEFLDGRFLFIDEHGRVLEVGSYLPRPLPIITGLRPPHFQLGELLETDSPDAFRAMVTYGRLLSLHPVTPSEEPLRLDISNPRDVRLRLYHFEVYLGGIENANEKVHTLQAIIGHWPAIRETRGFLDLRHPGDRFVFRVLT